MRSTIAALFLCILLAACGTGSDAGGDADGDDGASPELATLDSFPVTLEGELTLDVIEGDAEFGDYSDFNFGSLTVGDEIYLVHADGPVAQASGLPMEGGQARVTLSGINTESAGYVTYEISRIQTL